VVGAEALVRWQRPELGLLTPARFSPMAEEMGSIGAIGEWFFGRACRDTTTWRDAGHTRMRMAVNVTASQFEPGPPTMLHQALFDAGHDVSPLVVEVTDSMLMDDAGTARALMLEFKALGVPLSSDDFGTGCSSLGYLKYFPIES